MHNRKKLCAAVDAAVERSRRLRALAASRERMRAFLEPLGGEAYDDTLVSRGVTMGTVKEFTSTEPVHFGIADDTREKRRQSCCSIVHDR